MKKLRQVSIVVMYALILSMVAPSFIPVVSNAALVEAATVTTTMKGQTTVYGKVTAVNGKKVTLSLGTLNVPNGAPDLITLTGKSIRITISNTTSSISGSTVNLSDIAVGSILKVTYKKSIKNLVSVQIIGEGQEGSHTGGTTSVNTGYGVYNLKDSEALTGDTYSSTNADENAIRADKAIKATLTDVTVYKRSGATSSNDASSFYGLNAAILALGGSTLNINGGNVTAIAEGANGVFSYDRATINMKNTKINVTGVNSGGIEVAGGGIINAINLTINSIFKAAICSGRGGGKILVSGGTYTTSGSSGAPAIYSTADISVYDATLTANNCEAIVVEGQNSVLLNNCTVTGNMTGNYSSSTAENIHNVMLYQSMSGDAEVGNSSFTMTNGSITSKNGDMFYTTNTDSVFSLKNVGLSLANGTKLLVVAGNDGTKGWGKVGSNGGNCTFTATDQNLSGDISVDSISKLDMTLNNSSFIGAINSDGTNAPALSITLDSKSTWKLTADSYITEFNGNISNVDMNGHKLYVKGTAQN